MAFDDILGIPISFEDDESEGNQERNELWDAESYWALDTKDIWKTKEPVLRERGDTWKVNLPEPVEEDCEKDCEEYEDEDEDFDLGPFDEDEEEDV